MLTVAFLVLGWLALSVTGVAVLGLVGADLRARLWGLAPVLGVAVWAIVGHVVILVSGVRWALPVVGVVVAVLLVVGRTRGRRVWSVPRRAWIGLLASTVAGGAAALAVFVPTWLSGGTRVLAPDPTHSLDAFFYLSEAAWLRDHGILAMPPLASEPGAGTLTPGYGAARIGVTLPLRIGQPIVHAMLSALTGDADPADTFLPALALWTVLAVVAAAGISRLFGASPLVSVAAGFAVGASVGTAQQIGNQNADSLLGISLALATLGLGALALDHRRLLVPAALVLAGLTAVYTEYLVVLAPAAGAALLVRRSGIAAASRRGALVLVLAVAVAPVAWYRGLRGLLANLLGGVQDAQPSRYAADGWLVGIGRAIGTQGDAPTGGPGVLGWFAVAAALTGVIAVLVLVRRQRGALIGLVAGAAAFVTYLTIAGRGYTHQRTLVLILPLLALLAVWGWALLLRPRRAAVRRAVAVAGSALLLATGGTSAFVAAGDLDVDRASRSQFDSAYAEAAGWVAASGSAETLVAAPDLLEQSWLAYALRDDADVAFATLDSTYTSRERFWDGGPRRFLLVGSGVVVAAPPEAVVASNSRFRLVDLRAGGVVAAFPSSPYHWAMFAADAGSPPAREGAELRYVRSATADAFDLEFQPGGPNGSWRVEGDAVVSVRQDSERLVARLDATGETGTVTFRGDPSGTLRLIGVE